MPTLIAQKRHNFFLPALAWSPDGTLIAAGGMMHRKRKHAPPVLVWDAFTFERQASYRALPAGIHALAWSPDGARIAAVAQDAIVHIWDWRTNTIRFHHQYVRTHGPGAHLAWSPDGRWLATHGETTEITIWDTTSWQSHLTYAEYDPSWASTASRGYGSLNWSPDGTRIASIAYALGHPLDVRIWDTTTGRTLGTIPCEGYGVAWSPDSLYLAVSGNHSVSIWDTHTCELVRKLASPTFGQIASVSWSRIGNCLVIDGLHQWNSETGEMILEWRPTWTWPAYWSPDGTRFMREPADNIVQVWQSE